MNNIKMLYYDRIDVSEGIDVNNKSAYYLPLLLFLDKSFKFQPDICNGCLDVLIMYMNLNDIAIPKIHGVFYCYITNEISKSESHTFHAKRWFDWKKWNIMKHKHLLSHIKMGEEIRTFTYTEIEKLKISSL